jgi:hypothetical protein
LTFSIIKDESFSNLLKANLRKHYEKNRRGETEIHVSDLIPTNCIRRSYYTRKFPEDNPITDESLIHFVRGSATEKVITELSGIGSAQVSVDFHNIHATPDIKRQGVGISPSNFLIVELKNNSSGARLKITDPTFKSYLRQTLYYLVICSIETGVICITYNTAEFSWQYRDGEGHDHYIKRKDARPVEMESFRVNLSMDDKLREDLTNAMISRKDLLLKALKENNVSMLPRVKMKDKKLKCTRCPYVEKCWKSDRESIAAIKMNMEDDLLDEFIDMERIGLESITRIMD